MSERQGAAPAAGQGLDRTQIRGSSWVAAVPNPPQHRPLADFRFFAVLGTWMEEDVVEETIEAAFAQGCERVYLVDNDSPDQTVKRALAAGAVLARSFRTPHYDEQLRLALMNEVVREVSDHEADEHLWWLWMDADEFPHGPRGLDLRTYLEGLDRRFRVVGARYFNHYPGPGPAVQPGRSLLEAQPLCEEMIFPMCPEGHRKHPLLRFDLLGPDIRCGVGFHQASCPGPVLVEPAEPMFLHHFPFRDPALTRARLEALWGR